MDVGAVEGDVGVGCTEEIENGGDTGCVVESENEPDEGTFLGLEHLRQATLSAKLYSPQGQDQSPFFLVGTFEGKVWDELVAAGKLEELAGDVGAALHARQVGLEAKFK